MPPLTGWIRQPINLFLTIMVKYQEDHKQNKAIKHSSLIQGNYSPKILDPWTKTMWTSFSDTEVQNFLATSKIPKKCQWVTITHLKYLDNSFLLDQNQIRHLIVLIANESVLGKLILLCIKIFHKL
jgi:hypothetical protein